MKTTYPNLDLSIIQHCKTVDEAIQALEIYKEEQELLLEEEQEREKSEREKEEQENMPCNYCSGTGEQLEGVTCSACHGSGSY